MSRQLALVPAEERTRAGRDRLELLAALIGSPGFDPLYRSDVIRIPPDHPVYRWGCEVLGCDCVARDRGLCRTHELELGQARKVGTSRADFIARATPLGKHRGFGTSFCRICPDRPAPAKGWQLCVRHVGRWRRYRAAVPESDFEQWVLTMEPLPGYGTCKVTACCYLAESPAGLCPYHRIRYRDEGKPGNVRLPGRWMELFEAKGLPVPIHIDDERAFRQWCLDIGPIYADGVINLMGLQPLVRAEIQWGMHVHAQDKRSVFWDYTALQRLANLCRAGRVTSLFDLAEDWPRQTELAGSELPGRGYFRVRRIISGIVESLWRVYYGLDDGREAGFIETEHFGRRFPHCRSHMDLTAVSQRWLRDLLWDYLADTLRSADCPRTRCPLDRHRRAAIELSAFLDGDAPDGGHDPSLLREEHAQRFVSDQRHRERHGQTALGISRSDGKPSMVTEGTRRNAFNSLHAIAYRALGTGVAEAIGLGRDFLTGLPPGGPGTTRSRSPFTDEAARALADEGNLRRLAAVHDPHDVGYRDVWEAIVVTGRRASEVIELRLDCIGRYHGLPMLWHDQTKVGNYDEAVRIPEYLYRRLDERRASTLARFEDRHGRAPTAAERAAMTLFPSRIRNPLCNQSISYTRYCGVFRAWADSLDLGSAVSHQARHTMATNLLRAGATLAHVRRFLGHVSDRMAERYIQVAHSDLEDALNTVWVAGPGSAAPGKLLSSNSLAPLSKEKALTLSIDLSRRSTPTDGGFCTYQPVVNGSACPWNLDCENCDKFVMSGADLLYWRRKQEQWRAIAERAPDDATADYLHQVFEPTARAIDGLEKALAGLGLLDQALTLDMRRPQDYFHRVWSTTFRAADLAEVGDDPAEQAVPAAEGPA